jgi:hypothetical protein
MVGMAGEREMVGMATGRGPPMAIPVGPVGPEG